VTRNKRNLKRCVATGFFEALPSPTFEPFSAYRHRESKVCSDLPALVGIELKPSDGTLFVGAETTVRYRRRHSRPYLSYVSFTHLSFVFRATVKVASEFANPRCILSSLGPYRDLFFVALLPSRPQVTTTFFTRLWHVVNCCDGTLRRNIIRMLFSPITYKGYWDASLSEAMRSKPCFCHTKTRRAPFRRNGVACWGRSDPRPLALPNGFPLVIHGRASGIGLYSFGEAAQ